MPLLVKELASDFSKAKDAYKKIRNILKVEDEKDIRDSLKTILELNDYEVETAENGQIGLKKVIEHKKIGFGEFALDVNDQSQSYADILSFSEKDLQRMSFNSASNFSAGSEPSSRPSMYVSPPRKCIQR